MTYNSGYVLISNGIGNNCWFSLITDSMLSGTISQWKIWNLTNDLNNIVWNINNIWNSIIPITNIWSGVFSLLPNTISNFNLRLNNWWGWTKFQFCGNNDNNYASELMLGYKNWKSYLLWYNPINWSSQTSEISTYLEGNYVWISGWNNSIMNTTFYGFLSSNNSALIVSDMSQYITLYTLTRFDEWFYLYKLNYASIKFNNVSNYIHNTINGLNQCITKWGTVIYGCTQSNSMIIENIAGEWTGICFSGNNGLENITSFCTGDDSWFFNFQDEDWTNSRVCYINLSGVLTVVWTKDIKHSIKQKNFWKKIFNNFLKIKINNYGIKYDLNENEWEKKKNRKINKLKTKQLGIVMEEIYELFPKICDGYNVEIKEENIEEKYKNLKSDKKYKKWIEEIKETKNLGVNYNNLLLYFILSFQYFVNDINEKIIKFSNSYNSNNIIDEKNYNNKFNDIYLKINDLSQWLEILNKRQLIKWESVSKINNSYDWLSKEIEFLKKQNIILLSMINENKKKYDDLLLENNNIF